MSGLRNVGAILRTFSTKKEGVPDRVAVVKNAVDRLKDFCRRIDILVWSDERFADADCGLTAEVLLRSQLSSTENIVIHVFREGDLYCALLNHGVAMQLRAGMDYSLIISPSACAYATDANLHALSSALGENNVRVVGLAINELMPSIMEGRIANTFAIWHNLSLLTVGGFDFRAAQCADGKKMCYVRGWDDVQKTFMYYPLAGVEEVIPLARMVELYGPCVVPVRPIDATDGYLVPDPAKEPDLYRRHINKMATKTLRQSALLASIGYDLNFLKGGVIS